MSELSTAMTAVITFITGGGLIGGIVAWRKDKRDAKQNDLDYTAQFRTIAQEEVKATREELAVMGRQVKELERKVGDLEAAVRVKDRVITILVDYIGRLRDILNLLDPKRPLPLVPDEVKDYIK